MSRRLLTRGFRTNRDGSFNYAGPPILRSRPWRLNLPDLGRTSRSATTSTSTSRLHYNTEWTAGPERWHSRATQDPKSSWRPRQAHLTVPSAAKVNVPLPRARVTVDLAVLHLSIRNGWALAAPGTEVMHSLGGAGIATNYMA